MFNITDFTYEMPDCRIYQAAPRKVVCASRVTFNSTQTESYSFDEDDYEW